MQIKLLLIIFMVLFCIPACVVASNTDTIYFNNPVNDHTNAHMYIMKGINFYKSGNYDEAIKSYNRAIALAPNTEIAETGWAGKELIFYKEGKKEETLVCYYKLMEIDHKTNLIEKSKRQLMNSVSGSTTVSFNLPDSLSFIEETVIQIKDEIIQIENETNISSYLMPVAGGIVGAVLKGKIVSIASTMAPEIVVPGIILLSAYAYHDEINSIINSTIDSSSYRNFNNATFQLFH